MCKTGKQLRSSILCSMTLDMINILPQFPCLQMGIIPTSQGCCEAELLCEEL